MFQSPSTSSARNLDPYVLPLVSLAPVSDEQQTDENLEPPFVRVRATNAAFLHLDGGFRDFVDSPFNGDNTQFTIGNDPRNRLYTRKIQRFSIGGVALQLATPNINPRNNVVIFESAPGVTHTATIAEGYYDTLAAAYTALQNALNAALPPIAMGFVVTAAPFPGSIHPLQGRIAANLPWRFLLDPANLTLFKGKDLFNLPEDQNFTLVKTLGAAFLMYSRYIDICSTALTRYTKNPTAGNQAPSNLYARVYLSSPVADRGGFSLNAANFAPFGSTPEATNFRRDRAFEQVDISLLDDQGQPFYIPSLATETAANAAPSVILTTEV